MSMNFSRWIAVLIVVAFVLLAVYSFFPPQAQVMDRDSAANAALKDARDAYPNASLSILSVEGNETTGWNVKVKITLDAHSICPKVYVRDYELLPIRFREQVIMTQCDKLRAPIIYGEEAQADSGILLNCVRDAAQKGALGYFYEVPKDQGPGILPSKATSMVAGLNQSVWLSNQRVWAVEWRGADFSEVVLLDESARILNESC
jgi:hypothetical protein